MKINIFEITKRRISILGWSVGMGIVFLLIMLSESLGNNVDGDSYDILATNIAGDFKTELYGLVSFAFIVCSLLTMEQLRHALYKSNRFWLQLAQIVVMVLTVLGLLVGLVPAEMIDTDAVPGVDGTFLRFQLVLPFYINIVISLTNLFLGIGLVRCFGGRIRQYGIALAVLPVLSFLCGELYVYLYNNVGGLTLQTLSTYNTMILIFQIAIEIALLLLRNRTMKPIEEKEETY
ncbi:hypothetical protein [Prevotella aurantiaca]|uniref:hypothetical protein n=1 Tax=Prevotella aurantiaca TaxID=596085 RepID=UPI001CB11235|nr:hypothetical protein [Prevotella aurantiaca]MBF1386454.1 hypothetical protein [Prevotella aurantiaca]